VTGEPSTVAAVRLVPHYRHGQVEVVLAVVDCCPYCSARHVHGAGRDVGRPVLGWRRPHCVDRPAQPDYQLTTVAS
jgi:hypothetical protein